MSKRTRRQQAAARPVHIVDGVLGSTEPMEEQIDRLTKERDTLQRNLARITGPYIDLVGAVERLLSTAPNSAEFAEKRAEVQSLLDARWVQ